MIFNYIKIAFRNFKKRWPYFLINLLGLAIGMAAFLLLIGYTHFESNYESKHENRDNIYSVLMHRYQNGDLETTYSDCPNGIQTTIKNHVKGVKHVARYRSTFTDTFLRLDSVAATEKKVVYTDQDIFKILSINVLRGDREHLLDAPFTMVLTEEKAKKYFGAEDPIGKVIRIGNDFNNNDFKITGIVENLPKNTDLEFDFLMSFESAWYQQDWFQNNWTWWAFPTLLTLEKGYDITAVENQFPAYIEKYKPNDIDSNYDWKFTFQPLTEKHLHSNWLNKAINPDKEAKMINMLRYIAILILLISWINYINLSTASATERAKEVGVRKTLGGNRQQVFIQFLIEAFLINFIASLLSITIVWGVIKYFNEVIMIPGVSYFIKEKQLLAVFLLMPLLGVLIAGFYPARLISSFKSLEVLKTKTTTSPASAITRKFLVGFQFSVSMLLISATVIMMHQNRFLLNKDIGIAIKDKLIIKNPRFPKWEDWIESYPSFRDRLAKIPGVTKASVSSGIPSQVAGYMAAWRVEDGIETQQSFNQNGIDQHYIDNYGIKIIAGRNFSHDHTIQPNEVILSETACRRLGYTSYEDAIGRKMEMEGMDGRQFTIVGVVKDYYYGNLKREQPGIYFVKNVGNMAGPNSFSLKLNGQRSVADITADAKVIFDEMYPDDVFNTAMLEDIYREGYEQEVREQSIFKAFSLIAILLAIIGLIGLTSFIAQLKIKEVSIRKVLGANSKDISWLLSKEFLSVVIISVIIVIPLVIYFMRKWLMDYPYRIEIQPWHFMIAIVLVMLITSLVIVFNMLKVVRITPAKVLKSNE